MFDKPIKKVASRPKNLMPRHTAPSQVPQKPFTKF